MHVRVGAVGEGREDEQRVELGIQPFSVKRNISGRGHKERNSTGRETEERFQEACKAHLCSRSFIEMFCILFLDTFKVYSTVSLVVKNSMQLWIWLKVV